MIETTSRRAFLKAGVLGSSVITAGCIEVLSVPDAKLTLLLRNADSEPHLLRVEIIRANGESESSVFSEKYRLESASGDETPWVTLENILPAKQYLVRIEVDNVPIRHYHFSPDGTGPEGNDRLYVTILPGADHVQISD